MIGETRHQKTNWLNREIAHIKQCFCSKILTKSIFKKDQSSRIVKVQMTYFRIIFPLSIKKLDSGPLWKSIRCLSLPKEVPSLISIPLIGSTQLPGDCCCGLHKALVTNDEEYCRGSSVDRIRHIPQHLFSPKCVTIFRCLVRRPWCGLRKAASRTERLILFGSKPGAMWVANVEFGLYRGSSPATMRGSRWSKRQQR